MRRLTLLTLIAAAAAMPSAASAAVCGGTTATVVVCVHPENVDPDPYGGPAVGDCVYLASATCTPVFVPTPSFTSGPLVSTQ